MGHDPRLHSTGGHDAPHSDPIYETIEDTESHEMLVRERMQKAKEEFTKDSSEFEWWSDDRPGDLFRSFWFWPREFDELVPEKVLKHAREAQHEALLAFRELLNYWIERTAPDKKTSSGDKPGYSGPIKVK
jgi:hypothetical protein